MSHLDSLSNHEIDFLFSNLEKIFGQRWVDYAGHYPGGFEQREEWRVEVGGMSRVDIKNALWACFELRDKTRFDNRAPQPIEFKILGEMITQSQTKAQQNEVKKAEEPLIARKSLIATENLARILNIINNSLRNKSNVEML